MVIGTDCIGNCKSNYHTIITMMAPRKDMDVNDNERLSNITLRHIKVKINSDFIAVLHCTVTKGSSTTEHNS